MCFSVKSGTSFEVEILADGTVKVLTGDMRSVHMEAIHFLAFLARELGGETVQVKVPHAHVGAHTHGGITHSH